MAIQETVVVITSIGQEYTLPGEKTVDQVVSFFASSVSGLSGMEASVEDEGDVRTITFSPKTGTKGAISETVVVITSIGQEYTLPGEKTVDQVVSFFASSVSGLSGMEASVEDEGDIRTITFSPKTGTKGAISETVVVITSIGQEYTLPGEKTVDQVVSFFASSVSGLSGMEASVEDEGDIRTITFSPKTGTKGC